MLAATFQNRLGDKGCCALYHCLIRMGWTVMELASGAGLVSWSSQGRWKSLGVPPRPALPAEEVSGLPFSSQTQFPVPELLALVLSATPSCPPRTFPPICISWEAVFGARGVPRPCAVRLPRTRRQLAGVGRPALWSTVFSCACAAGPGRAVRKSSSSRRRAELPARLEFSWNERVWVVPGACWRRRLSSVPS